MKESLKKTFALQFMGSDTNSLIQIKTELNKGPGDRLTFGIRQQLGGAGVQGDGTLEGNEEALVTYSQNVTIDQLRHAVRSSGKMSEQRVPFVVRDEARDGLADWWSERIDRWFFNQVCGNSAQNDLRFTGMQAAVAPDSGHQVFPGAETAEASISATTSNRFSLALIDKAVEKGKLAVNYLRPVRVGSNDYLVAFLHPFQVTSLRQSLSGSTQWSDIQKAAMQGGQLTDNPIFTGALGLYNGVILHESVRIPSTLTGDANTNVTRAVLLGAQAACLAFGRGYGKNTFSWKEELFDYENQLGVGAGCIGGLVKTRFNGSDFATVTMSSYEVAS
jgi:N4-gp56 family major capsid protein